MMRFKKIIFFLTFAMLVQLVLFNLVAKAEYVSVDPETTHEVTMTEDSFSDDTITDDTTTDDNNNDVLFPEDPTSNNSTKNTESSEKESTDTTSDIEAPTAPADLKYVLSNNCIELSWKHQQIIWALLHIECLTEIPLLEKQQICHLQ